MKQQVTLYTYIVDFDIDELRAKYTFTSRDIEFDGWLQVGKQTITVDVPDSMDDELEKHFISEKKAERATLEAQKLEIELKLKELRDEA